VTALLFLALFIVLGLSVAAIVRDNRDTAAARRNRGW
jgi:hypothetical protein